MFGQKKTAAPVAPAVVMNNAFWAAQAENARKGAVQRAEQQAILDARLAAQKAEDKAFNEYRKTPEYAKVIKALDKSERENRLKKEAEEFRKNPYAGLSGVRLRKSRRSRKSHTRQSRRSRNAANL
jgi:hypothetical protein